jgi:hypothetical protein
MRVLDLGGRIEEWARLEEPPAQLVVVNVETAPPSLPGWARWVVGDACALPDGLNSEKFDLVYSNSVIEHVGGHAQRLAMASVVYQAGRHHWVETPYRYFPLEPHWMFPAFQFLPVRARVAAARRWPLSWSRPQGRDAVASVLEVELLGKTEMQYYFPDSELLEERAAGWVKSIIAVR